MGVKITGISAVAAMFQNDAEKATKAGLRAIRREAKKVMKLSQEYAPVDEGNLEAAHKIEEDRGGTNRRVRVFVDVGGVVNGVDVDEYATVMHEGTYHLGAKSEAKAAATGKAVGRKYLERALDERGDKIIKAIEQEVKKEL